MPSPPSTFSMDLRKFIERAYVSRDGPDPSPAPVPEAARRAPLVQPRRRGRPRDPADAVGRRAGAGEDPRRAGGILTAAGEEAAARAEAILAQAEDLVQAARGAGQPLAGRFRLGVIPTIAPFLLPRALPTLRRRFPKLRLFLREDLTGRLIPLLKSGALDAALIALPYDVAGLDWADVEDDELFAAFPANHPLTAESRVPPERLEAE